MITGNMYTVVEFDTEGRKQIESAAATIREVIDAFRKVGGQTSSVEENLEEAIAILYSIIDGERW